VAPAGALARAYYLHQEHGRSLEWADRTLAGAERLDLVAIIADALVSKGTVLFDLGRGYEGGTLERGALELASNRGLTMIAMRARNNLGYALTYRDPVAALELLRPGIADAERLGLRTWVVGLWDQAADAARTTGEWEWSLAGLERLLSTDLAAEHRAALTRQVITLRALRGQPVDALVAEMDQLLADTTSPTLRATAN